MDKKFFLTVIALFLLGGVLFYTFQIFAPFLTSLIWASFIVIIFSPLHKKLLNKLNGKENLAAFLMVVTLILLVLLPVSLLLIILLKELVESAQVLNVIIHKVDFQNILKWPMISQAQEFISQYVDLESLNIKEALVKSASNISKILIVNSKSFLAALSGFFILLALIAMNMFFLFRDGKRFMDYLKWMVPISEEVKSQIIDRSKEVINASIFGGVVTAVVQGFLGGIAFFFLSIPSSILWGVLMGILSFLPMAGPPIIWAPAAIWLFTSGHVIKGAFLVFWGLIVIGMSDNILRPILISKVSSESTRLNTLVLFLSVLGGLKVFGFMGIVMGPLTIVMAMTLIEICRMSLVEDTIQVHVDLKSLGEYADETIVESSQEVSSADATIVESSQGVGSADATIVESSQGVGSADATIVESSQEVGSADATIVESSQEVGSADATIVESSQGVDLADETIVESSQEVGSADATIVESSQEVGSADATIVESSQGLNSADATIVESSQEVGSADATIVESSQGVDLADETIVESSQK